ncbi:PH domain-containing protein [Nakamurella endophytica]|uniref:Low molecular weight protein antigen 6 PH domain-containing protein n=1 Tax=Nakamurella endophytica TaxID=1748367 RepID=A0A917SM42_9ACTN|nr:PH domain-containing protein [Nakamurella endophytica]GGL86469.1 hypothetical protein GCM10011594_02620 [Nakamurella endophytica]
MRSVYRPAFGKVLAALVAVVCAVGLVVISAHDGVPGFARSAPWLLLAAGAAWALFWRPEVVVDDAGVHLANVLRTVDLPWPSIQRIDTKWALALTTRYGTYTAWAAPAPSRWAHRDLSPGDLRHLPESTYGAGASIRPGDSPHSPSGQAALAVRRRWEELRDAGHLDDPRLEFDRPPVTWHRTTIAAAVVLVVLGVLAALV